MFDLQKFQKTADLFQQKMKRAGLNPLLIDSFLHYFKKLFNNENPYISESEIEPLDSLPDLNHLDDSYEQIGKSVKSKIVSIKLNGGLGTTMGLKRAKTLLEVKDGYSLLEIFVKNAKINGIPIILMNSFRTQMDCMHKLMDMGGLEQDVPWEFLQTQMPKIRKDDFQPLNLDLMQQNFEWYPPGHGDIFASMERNGLLDELLDKGYRYAFISNGDNLGAAVSMKILGYIWEHKISYLMEVIRRNYYDRKGGHLAIRRKDKQLIIREISQCAPDELPQFQDIERHHFFNSNNIWVDLEVLKKLLKKHGGHLPLPMIRNEKYGITGDKSSPVVYQLETGMGSAIEIFPSAKAMIVDRRRFLPVKSQDDFERLKSDKYFLTDDFRIRLCRNAKESVE